jgi:tetratricopeptide (TPR) repeat protein
MLRHVHALALALADLQAIPQDRYGDALWVALAECNYALGSIAQARDAVLQTGSLDQRGMYTLDLILRDLGECDNVAAHLAHASELLPSYFLLRTAGDFMFDLGRIKKASTYYRAALDQRNTDADTQHLYALSLFHTSNALGCCEILTKLRDARRLEDGELNFCRETFGEWNVSQCVRLFNRTRPDESPLKTAAKNFQFLLILAASMNHPIATLQRVSREPFDAPTLEGFEFPSPDPTLADVARDADRLGARCLIPAPEVVRSPRVIRTLGLCVLALSQRFATGYRKCIELCCAILGLADLRRSVRWTMDGSGDVRDVPVYYQQQGERLSPRFPREKGFALHRLRNGIRESSFGIGKDMSTMSTVAAVYGMVQHDVGPKWPIGNHASEKMDDLMKPSINMRFVGASGFDLFVRPTIDLQEVRKYNEAMDLHWKQMAEELRDGKDKMSFGLPNVMQLFWMLRSGGELVLDSGNSCKDLADNGKRPPLL